MSVLTSNDTYLMKEVNLNVFEDFDFSDFWEIADPNSSIEGYTDENPTDELIRSVEQELGYKLPSSYIELMKLHNGGRPKNYCHPMPGTPAYPEDYVEIAGIMGIGLKKSAGSLCGCWGSQFIIDEWQYPDIGIYICWTRSAGHDMVLLDYSKCGNDGEPEVMHVDSDADYKKTFIAPNFETFVRGLVSPGLYNR